MAIPKDLEPLVEGFTAEEKQLFDNLLTKQSTAAKAKDPNAPTLAEGWLRQADYDRKHTLSKAELKKAEDRSKELEDWYKENRPIHDKALERTRELEAKSQELEQQLEQARAARAAAGGDQVDEAQLKARVEAELKALSSAYGYVTKADAETVIAQQAAKLAKEEAEKQIGAVTKRYFEETLPAGVNLAADVAEICVDHKSEFGERLDRKKFSEFMVERKLTDPMAAYSEYVKPQRDEREFKKRVEDEVKQRISGIAVGGGSGPLSMGPMPKGAVQMRMDRDAAANGDSTAVLAAKAAQELRAEGKF